MSRTKLMRAPLKYVQGKNSLVDFYKETENLGKDIFSFVPEADTEHALIKSKRVSEMRTATDNMRFLAV